MEGKRQGEREKLSLKKGVKELEDLFIRRNEKELYRSVLAEVEKPLIENVLNRTGGNQLRAARILGINRNTLHSKIKKLGIEVARWKKY